MQFTLYVPHILQCSYTGCPRRNVPDFGRVFLMLKYTNITQNTYYIVEVSCYIKRYKGCPKQNLSIHGHNMGSKLNFHVEFCNTLFQKCVVNLGIRPYNKLPESIKKNLDNFKLFKKEFKSIHPSHSFHTVDEFWRFWVMSVSYVTFISFIRLILWYHTMVLYCIVLYCIGVW
jgi:hypothetical protein